MGFLDGVLVVDSTRLLPGAYCTMLLSDMGAEVVKVEQPGLGDYMRATPPTVKGRSPAHATVNRNKRSVGVDLKSAKGKEVMRKLLRRADIFVEGFRPGAMRRLGFSYPDVKKVNRRIVYCSISAFGQESPMSSMPGHDINFQAMAGTMGYSGSPSVPFLQLSDVAAGMYAAVGVLGALAGGKRPAFIDVPMVQSLMSWAVVPASSFIATGGSPSAGDSLVLGSTPFYNVYRTSDGGHIAVAAIEERFWHNLLEALGVPELEPKRFGTPSERKEVAEKLTRVFATRTRDEWAEALAGKDTCATPVLTIGEAFNSGWARASPMLRKTSEGTVIWNPLKSEPSFRTAPVTGAPSLGGDTDKVLASLGYSKAEVLGMRASGAVQ